MIFNLPANFHGGGIQNVPGVMMKTSEQARGTALAGLTVKVTSGFFLIGLSNAAGDKDNNIKLLKERPWLDIPVVYADGKRAILAVEKGAAGERACKPRSIERLGGRGKRGKALVSVELRPCNTR